MTLSDIEYADEILSAISRGQLVVFAGAGTSVGHEMQLPGFANLAKEVARQCHRPLSKEQEEYPDKYLGRLSDDFGVKVHQITQRIIGNSKDKCNPLHRGILGLFKAGDRAKIVTTNYDQGFEAAASLSGMETRSYSAPALPSGAKFNGIVHVHGSIDDCHGMVVTDRDYGRAYLTEGWARRFLIGLFSKHTILFIGYSHSDHDLNYLVRALGSEGEKLNRYAWIAAKDLAEGEGEKSKKWWLGHGVTPVVFESHDAIREAVQVLSRYVDPSPEAFRDEICKIASLEPSLGGGLRTEIKIALEKEETARYFTNSAKSPSWLRLLDRHGYLECLFSQCQFTPAEEVMADWAARQFLDDKSEVLIEVLSVRKFKINENFRRLILFAIKRNAKWPDGSDKAVLSRWTALTLRTFEITPGDRSLLRFLAERCAERGQPLLAVNIFIEMAGHDVVPFQRSYLPDNRVGIGIELASEYYSLSLVWQEALKPRITEIAEQLLNGICERIRKMNLDASLWADGAYREVFWRSAIEPHQQDEGRHDGFGVLVDAARDSIEHLGKIHPYGFNCRAERLLESPISFLRRLGIHAVRMHDCYSADEKVTLLLKYVKLSSSDEHHEAYLLISANYSGASDRVRNEVRQHILKCAAELSLRPGCDVETGDRMIFRWFDCLLASVPDCISAAQTVAGLKAKYPNWTVGAHPSFKIHAESGEWIDPRPARYADEIESMQPREIAEWYKENAASVSCRAFGLQLTKACTKNIESAFGLLTYLKSVADWDSEAWAPVIDSFSDASFPVERIESVLDVLHEPELLAKCTRPISNFIEACVKNHGQALDTDRMARLADFSELAWVACPAPSLGDAHKKNWLGSAINDSSGRIVLSWIEALSISATKAGASRCLPAPMEERLSHVLRDLSSKADLARVILASQYGFLHSLNAKWSRDYLLPLFTSDNCEHFFQAWDGFLTWGALSTSVEVDLRPAFLAAIERIYDSSSKDLTDKFIKYYAIMAVYQQEDPTEAFLPKFLVKSEAKDDYSCARLASYICFIMRQMSYESQTKVSKKWLLKYCQMRSSDLPVALSDAELSELIRLIPHSGAMFADLANVLSGMRPIKFSPAWLYELDDNKITSEHPAAIAKLLVYMSTCDGASRHAETFKKISDMLKGLPRGLSGDLKSALIRIGVN